MLKLGTMVKVGAVSCALALSTPAALAASTFQVPLHYTLELVDGQTSDFGYNRFTRQVTLAPGRHQMVLLFEGSFGSSKNSRLVQAANPIVIEFSDMDDNTEYSFHFKVPASESEAESFSRSQKITITQGDNKTPVPQDVASYFILTSDSGFPIFRDYRDDLASVGRLYAPNASAIESKGNQSVNDHGVMTIQAHAKPGSNNFAQTNYTPNSGYTATPVEPVMSATVTTAAQEAKAPVQEPQQIKASANGAVSYDALVDLYNRADDKTKLQFVKYIMTH